MKIDSYNPFSEFYSDGEHRERIKKSYSPVKGTKEKFSSLKLLCMKCTRFSDKDEALEKHYFEYDDRGARFICHICNTTINEKQVKEVLKLDLPEYIYYDDAKKEVNEVLKQREEEERFIIKPMNTDTPAIKKRKRGVRVIK